MRKGIKTILKILTCIIVILGIIALCGWLYVKSAYLDFEDGFPENDDLKEVTISNYTFLDRNSNNKLDPYEDDRLSIGERVDNLISLMTIEEKIHLLKGSGIASAMGRVEPGEGIPGAVGTIVATPRLGLPTIYLSDGPAGLRIQPTRENDDKTYYCTAFPIATMLSSTWNKALVTEVGNAMGNEAKEYGLDVILGPGVNIHRHPFCGRNFEYYSEDPVLTGNIGAAIVNGIQSNGVGTSVKHYVANNQETSRAKNDSRVSERALREIYLKGFEIIVDKSKPWTIMSSYNKVNGTYTSESKYLLTDVLRKDIGFDGVVMTDWYGGKDAVAQVSAGNDLLEPGTKPQWKALKKAHEKGTLDIETIDRSVGRILELILKSKKWSRYQYSNNPDLKAHAAITRQSAAEGIVLLKNENTLPLAASQNIALLGVTSFDFIAGGTGSGDVNEAYTISLEQGLEGSGYKINKVSKSIFENHKTNNEEEFLKPEGINAMFEPYEPPQIKYTINDLQSIAETADVAIITIGRNSGEGGDRKIEADFRLTDIEQNMIANTCEVFQEIGKKVIVVLNVGGVIETSTWKSKPDAIVLAWQGGQEGGNSCADIISGAVNPSGKLPMTFPVTVKDHASSANFPMEGGSYGIGAIVKDLILGKKEVADSEKVKNVDYTDYEEGIYVGYRHFDKSKIPVSYPFGFGLSYTEFISENANVRLENDTIHAQVTVKNIGKIKGKEVIQLYISKENSLIDRPVQELKAFEKTSELLPNDTEILDIKFPTHDLQYWDENQNKWVLEKGEYSIMLKTSSRDKGIEAKLIIE